MTLCRTCRHGTVVDLANGSITSYCDEMFNDGRLFVPVTRCTSYDDTRFTSRYDLEKIAWTIRTDKSGKAIGFVPPKPEK